jgi:tungstate transport system ATP-binding protein
MTIERIIHEINRTKGITVIFTTHNLMQASKLADETLSLFEGKVARSIYENIFNAHIETDARGCKYCALQNGLRLVVKTENSGQIRISIDPSKVKIIQRESDYSLDNTFKGRLIQLTEEHGRVRALVDAGIPLSVLIPKEVFGNLHLVLGEELWLTCPGESIEVF